MNTIDTRQLYIITDKLIKKTVCVFLLGIAPPTPICMLQTHWKP